MTPPAPTWLLQLADSELAALLRHDDGRAELRLAVAHLRHPATGEAGHAPGLSLWLDGATWSGEVQPGRLREGRLWHGGRWLGEWPVPGLWQAGGDAPLRLEWQGPYGDAVALSARSMRAGFAMQAEDVQTLWRPWLRC